ncbi:MAG: potassium transporter TrkG, partial [Gammaproteobacteria bacterium]|nr:potassium transporter TrkG [Gammaproteobacteria bacterium]
MHLFAIQRILGLLLAVFSLTMLPPAALSWWFSDGALSSFLTAFFLVLATGLALWLPVRKVRREMRVRDGFLIVVTFWVALGISGSVPLILDKDLAFSITDSVFESVSGLTTTGATVITGIDLLPPSILFYRQLLQWLGGM